VILLNVWGQIVGVGTWHGEFPSDAKGIAPTVNCVMQLRPHPTRFTAHSAGNYMPAIELTRNVDVDPSCSQCGKSISTVVRAMLA
jgi:hypothetical protein